VYTKRHASRGEKTNTKGLNRFQQGKPTTTNQKTDKTNKATNKHKQKEKPLNQNSQFQQRTIPAPPLHKPATPANQKQRKKRAAKNTLGHQHSTELITRQLNYIP
jgi:hypothetical protein